MNKNELLNNLDNNLNSSLFKFSNWSLRLLGIFLFICIIIYLFAIDLGYEMTESRVLINYAIFVLFFIVITQVLPTTTKDFLGGKTK